MDDKTDIATGKAAYKEATRVRNLILCFDGTGQPINKNSNVLQFFKCLRKDNETQIVYYQPGLGTNSDPTLTTNPVTATKNLVDKAFAWSIKRHVQNAYRFLVQNYKPGDKISLFGFSRGAYTARVLRGFVQKVGLLPSASQLQIPYAWQMFERSDDPDGLKKCEEYKKVFSMAIDVKFDFIGLWDTVASLGIRGTELPFSNPILYSDIRVFRQALALDERRMTFTPNFKLTKKGPQSEPETYASVHPLPNEALGNTNERFLDRSVREIWFAGCHSDVGGGSTDKQMRNSLARISLRWMIRECFRTSTGIIFDDDMLVKIGFGSTPYYEDSTPTKWNKRRMTPTSAPNEPGSATAPTGIMSRLRNVFWGSKPDHDNVEVVLVDENVEEHHDALSPSYDQLSRKPYWWIPELIPREYRIQNSSGGNRNKCKRRFNLGKGRKIYGDAWNTAKDQGKEGEVEWYIEVHESVRTRIKKYEGPKGESYKPLAWFTVSDANVRNAKRTRGASDSEFHWEGGLEEMCASKGGQMIRWVK